LANRDGQWFFIPTRANDLVMGNLTRFDLDPVTPNNPVFIKIANAIWGISNTVSRFILKVQIPLRVDFGVLHIQCDTCSRNSTISEAVTSGINRRQLIGPVLERRQQHSFTNTVVIISQGVFLR